MRIVEHQILPYHADRAPPGGRVLVLAPHPDDEVLGCGGAIMRHMAANDPVDVVILTDGAFGKTDDRDRHRRIREDESRRAAEVLGCNAPHFWGLPDRGLEYGESLVRRILDAIETLGADLVYAPSWWEMHPDHFTAALAAAEAVRRSPRATRLLMYEVGVPLHPNRLLDITDILGRKMAAMACFASQLAQQRYDQHIAALNTYRTYTLPGSVGAAEAYRMLTQEELRQDPLRAVRPGIYYAQTGTPETTPPPLVSIILDERDDQDWADTIDSIGLQTYANIEVLALSPPPGPETSPLGERYPIRRLAAAPEASRAQRLNLALDQAQGELLAVILEAVRLEPDHIASLTEALEGAPDAGCAYAGIRFEPPRSQTTASPEVLNRCVRHEELWGGAYLPLSCCMIRRRLVSDGGRFDETLASGDAWDFLVQLSRRSRLLHLERIGMHVQRAGLEEEDPIVSESPRYEGPSDAAFAKWQATWSTTELREIIAVRDQLRAEAEAVAQRLTRELSQSGLALEQAQAQTQALRDRLASHETDAQRQTALAEQLRQENATIRASTSWRITAPMRALITRLRGKRP